MTIKSDVTTIHPVLPERLPDFQLLDLPAVRDALGLLQASRGADRLRTRRHGRLYMGQESLTFRSVHACGCVTHWERVVPLEGARVGSNARNFEPEILGTVQIEPCDGASDWVGLEHLRPKNDS
jgi:hypothetical protein